MAAPIAAEGVVTENERVISQADTMRMRGVVMEEVHVREIPELLGQGDCTAH